MYKHLLKKENKQDANPFIKSTKTNIKINLFIVKGFT